jgi:hypothetical protein
MINVICAVRKPLPYGLRPNTLGDPRPHASMDHRYISLHFSIQNSNSYSLTSQTFMIQGSHMGPPPVMPWGGPGGGAASGGGAWALPAGGQAPP